MSGLTLGLLGMDTNTLEILKRQGTPSEVRIAENRTKLGVCVWPLLRVFVFFLRTSVTAK